MILNAGRLRHRAAIQEKIQAQDPVTGEIILTWQTVDGWGAVPCAIEALSAREFIAASATQSQIVARITMRYREGFLPTMRIVHKGSIYNPAGFLPDKDSGLEYVTIPVSTGVNEG